MSEIIASSPTPVTEGPQGPLLELTQSALSYIRSYLERKPDLKDKHFRISVEGGGCSGYQYNFSFDTQQQDDLVLEQEGIKALVDPQSKLFLKGSVVDYTDDFRGSGFVVQNPNSKGSCGCGVSFSV